MKLKNILISFFAVIYVAAGCSRADNANTAQRTGNIDDTGEMTSILTDDNCFDKKMEQWFVKFNQLQNQGLDMEKAHHEAIASIAREFVDCNDAPDAISGSME